MVRFRYDHLHALERTALQPLERSVFQPPRDHDRKRQWRRRSALSTLSTLPALFALFALPCCAPPSSSCTSCTSPCAPLPRCPLAAKKRLDAVHHREHHVGNKRRVRLKAAALRRRLKRPEAAQTTERGVGVGERGAERGKVAVQRARETLVLDPQLIPQHLEDVFRAGRLEPMPLQRKVAAQQREDVVVEPLFFLGALRGTREW